jgi:hypothetical protein
MPAAIAEKLTPKLASEKDDSSLPAVLSFISLWAIQVSIAVVYKSTAIKGAMRFSPASAILCAEALKGVMSWFLLAAEGKSDRSDPSMPTFDRVKAELLGNGPKFILKIFGLATLYAINNNFIFHVYLITTPSTVAMTKATTSAYVALLLFLVANKALSSRKWITIIVQVLGLFICENGTMLGGSGSEAAAQIGGKECSYLFITLTLSAISSVWNQILVQDSGASLNAITFFLYFCGVGLNTIAFNVFPPPGANHHVGFFDGFDWRAGAVIVCNSFLGIAIAYTYKYGGAIIKTFAGACAGGALIFMDPIFFSKEHSMASYAGAVVLFLASYQFLDADKLESMLPQTARQLSSRVQILRLPALLLLGVIFASAVIIANGGEIVASDTEGAVVTPRPS